MTAQQEEQEALARIAASLLDKSDDFIAGMETAHNELTLALYIRLHDEANPMTESARHELIEIGRAYTLILEQIDVIKTLRGMEP